MVNCCNGHYWNGLEQHNFIIITVKKKEIDFWTRENILNKLLRFNKSVRNILKIKNTI